MLAVSAAEVLEVSGIVKVDGKKEGEKVLVLTLASDHGMQDGQFWLIARGGGAPARGSVFDGDSVALDDMRGDLNSFNARQLKVRRFGVISPSDAKVDLKDVAVKEMLKSSTGEVLSNFQRQYDHYKSEFDAAGTEGKFKQREITLFNRLVLDVEDAELPSWSGYTSGGLVNSVKPAVTKEYQTFEHSLVYTANPQMLDQEAWHEGAGCWVQLAISAALQFRDEQGRWPAEADGGTLATMVKAISEEQRSKETGCNSCREYRDHRSETAILQHSIRAVLDASMPVPSIRSGNVAGSVAESSSSLPRWQRGGSLQSRLSETSGPMRSSLRKGLPRAGSMRNSVSIDVHIDEDSDPTEKDRWSPDDPESAVKLAESAVAEPVVAKPPESPRPVKKLGRSDSGSIRYSRKSTMSLQSLSMGSRVSGTSTLTMTLRNAWCTLRGEDDLSVGKMSEFRDTYVLQRAIGEGGYGTVQLIKNKASGKLLAMKRVQQNKHTSAELAVFKVLDNPYIVRLYNILQACRR
eukprot:s1172_g2.t1